MSTSESRTVPRGVLWMVVTIAGVIIITLATVTASVVSNWALMVDKRGLDNQQRITSIETNMSGIKSQLNSIERIAEDNKALLLQHIDKASGR